MATLIDKEDDAKTAAAQLGHASEQITDAYYIAKPVLASDVSDILEQLGADRGPDDHMHGPDQPETSSVDAHPTG